MDEVQIVNKVFTRARHSRNLLLLRSPCSQPASNAKENRLLIESFAANSAGGTQTNTHAEAAKESWRLAKPRGSSVRVGHQLLN
jgi:hypothetical protein